MLTRSSTPIPIGADNPSVAVKALHYRLTDAELVDRSLQDGEGTRVARGALSVTTGKHTGRSPEDKYIVDRPGITDEIWWDGNQRLAPDAFNTLFQDVTKVLRNTTVHVQDLNARTGVNTVMHIRMINSLAWHALFIRNLLVVGNTDHNLEKVPDLTIINLPEFRADPVRHQCQSDTIIALDIARSLIIIGGSSYGGENKKAVFTYLNYALPALDILPMHCSASYPVGRPESPSLFFGLSGTGKTTLSTDNTLILVGDDEHGWSDEGIFNIEGGCYAKTQGLTRDKEPEIHFAATQSGTVLENVIVDPDTMEPDFADTSLTENTRSAYDISKIANADTSGSAGQPANVFLLTCDAYGVLPPIAKLGHEQALEFFMTGYTSKIAGTERGIKVPKPVFSECYARPFLPRPPSVYCTMFLNRIQDERTNCWLINTGWQGGPVGIGTRIELEYTRRMVRAVIANALQETEFVKGPILDLRIPRSIRGVPDALLNPANSWVGQDYEEAAGKLSDMFEKERRRRAAIR